MHPYSLIYMESRNNQSYTATGGLHEVGASNAIDKLLTTDENKLWVGPALDSKFAANHDARLISAGVLSVFIEKQNDKHSR